MEDSEVLSEGEDKDEYLSEEFVEDAVDDDGIAPWEAWFIEGWRQAFVKMK